MESMKRIIESAITTGVTVYQLEAMLQASGHMLTVKPIGDNRGTPSDTTTTEDAVRPARRRRRRFHPAKNAGRPWTRAEDVALTALLAEGKSYDEIGDEIGRSVMACKGRRHTLGLPAPRMAGISTQEGGAIHG